MLRSDLITLIKKDFQIINGIYKGISKWIAFNTETNQISLYSTDRNCFNIEHQTFLIVLSGTVNMCGSLGYSHIVNSLFNEYMQTDYYKDVEESPYIFNSSRYYYDELEDKRVYYIVNSYSKDGKIEQYSFRVGSLTWFTDSYGNKGDLFGSFSALFQSHRNLWDSLVSAVRPNINNTQYHQRQFENAIYYFTNNLSKFVKYSTSNNPNLHHYENVRDFIRWVHTQPSINCCLLDCFNQN